MENNKVTSNGVPHKLYKHHNIHPSQMRKDSDLTITRVVENPVKAFRGLGKGIVPSNLQDRLREEWEG